MTIEQKTVPFWQASKHMKENYVVYAVSLYFIRVFNNMHQFYSTEGWKEIGCFIEPNFPCISRPDIDYHTGQPKVEQEPTVVDWDTAYLDMRTFNKVKEVKWVKVEKNVSTDYLLGLSKEAPQEISYGQELFLKAMITELLKYDVRLTTACLDEVRGAKNDQR